MVELVVVGHEPRQVLGAVLAGLGGEVAELAVAAPPAPAGPGPRDRGAMASSSSGYRLSPSRWKRRTPGLMVDPGGGYSISGSGTPDLGDLLVGFCNRVAAARRSGVSRPLAHERPAQHRHRVGVVQEDRLGAQLVHVVGDGRHHRDGAQRAEDPADPEGLGDGLAQPVALGDLEIDAGWRRSRPPGSR